MKTLCWCPSNRNIVPDILDSLRHNKVHIYWLF